VVLEFGELLAPLGNRPGVSDPDLPGMGVVFVAEAEGENFLAAVEEEMGVFLYLRIGVVGRDELREGKGRTGFVIWHGGSIA
jgi:hypothetical protein